MSREEYKAYCIYRGEHFLTWLRDGDYECHILADMGGVSENTFKDIVALLLEDKLVELYDDDTKIKITNPGRAYLLNKATDITYLGSGILHKEAWEGGVNPRLSKELNNKKSDNHFISSLTAKQKKQLITELKEHGISSQPTKIISFLEGRNDVKFTVEKMHHMAYLLSRLKEEKLIKFVRGNGFFKHFESAIYHLGSTMVHIGMSEMRRQVLDKRYDTNQASSIVDAIISKLKGK